MERSPTSTKTLSSVDTRIVFQRGLCQSKGTDFRRLSIQFQMVRKAVSCSCLCAQIFFNLEHPKVSLHGGVDGFDARDWKRIPIPNATLFSEKEKKDIAGLPDSTVFTHTSEEGDQGFPGQLLIEVLFAVSSGNLQAQPLGKSINVGCFYIVYRARLLEGSQSRITPINLTQVSVPVLSSVEKKRKSICY